MLKCTTCLSFFPTCWFLRLWDIHMCPVSTLVVVYPGVPLEFHGIVSPLSLCLSLRHRAPRRQKNCCPASACSPWHRKRCWRRGSSRTRTRRRDLDMEGEQCRQWRGKFRHDCAYDDISEVISNSVSLFSTVSSISKYYRLLYLHVPPMISLLPIAVAST